MGTTALKLEGTNGDLKEITTTEENYLAYQAGLHLAELDSADVSAITASSSGSTSIGTYTDTNYGNAPGSHGFSSGNVPITQTTTTLYQKEGVAPIASTFRYPVEFNDNGGTPELHELDSSEVDTLSDRLLSRIATSEYPGTFKLGSSSPGGTYSTYKSNIFQDRLQTSVAGTAYNLYVKSSMAAPSTIRPVSIKRSSGLTGSFQGLQEMSDAEIKSTFGSRVQSRVMNGSAGIGTYQLRSNVQGSPTDTGTWTSRGTATDTRYDLSNVDYSADYTRNAQVDSTRNSTADFVSEQDYVGNYTRNFTANFVGEYTGDFTGNFIGDFLGDYGRNFVGDYVGDYARDFIGNYSRSFLGDYVGNYSRNFEGNYTGNYSRNFLVTT